MVERRKMLIWFAYIFSAILLIVIVFFLTLWLLNKFAGSPPADPGEYPESPIGNSFPPPANFVKFSNLYFNGPYLLEENNNINNAGIFLILCQKDESYGIIYIGETGGGIELSNDSCWVDSCGGNSLYIATLWTPIEKYKEKERQAFRSSLEIENNPSCVLDL